MRFIFSLILFHCIYSFPLGANTGTDSSLKGKNYLELRIGSIIYLRGSGVNGDKAMTKDRVTSLFSENYRLDFGRRFKHFLIGGVIDLSKFNLVGNTKSVGIGGCSQHGQSCWSTRYNIKQKINYYNFAGGISVSYLFQLHRFSINPGLSLNFVFDTFDSRISNSYSGEQSEPSSSLPIEVKNYRTKKIAYHGRDWYLPYYGTNLNVGYMINKHLTISLFCSVYYTKNAGISGRTWGALPYENIYNISKIFWINNGLSLCVFYP